MNELEKLYNRILQRVNINLRELKFDVSPFVGELLQLEQMYKFYAFYGITTDHPLDLRFYNSGLAGSYFLGKCKVKNSLLYKSDIRGDELKRSGEAFTFNEFSIDLLEDEVIKIEHSALVKTLVHNFSHDPETPEKFFIKDTLSMDYANIHGAPSDGCVLGPFATVDLTTMRDCVIGSYSYIQAGEISHLMVRPGTIWVNSSKNFNFLYQYRPEKLKKYISFSAGSLPSGALIDFIEKRKDAFQRIFNAISLDAIESVPNSSSLDRYAVVVPHTIISENVLISQRSYLENSFIGKGANVQENCFIINSKLAGFNVTAHGAKIIETDAGRNVFVGFNSFLCGKSDSRLVIGDGCVILPHTIIDISEPLTIPDNHLVWGLVTNQQELEINSMSLEVLSKVDTFISRGEMLFEGSGASFVKAFEDRIDHILEANGAFFDGKSYSGHAQKNQNLSLNTIQPFLFGEMKGMYPNIIITP